MLNSRVITVGCLIVWTGIGLGLILLTLAQLLGTDDLSRWGIVCVCLACTYSVHRQLAIRDDRMRQAFETGRDYERGQLSSVR
jgi:hypothetical protein